MSRTYRAAVLLLLAACLASCDSSEPGKVSLDDYEGPEGEAIVRHVIKTLPPVHPEIPKVYTVVKGPKLKSTSMDFIRRMDDLKLTFISGEVLTMRDDADRTIIDPRSGLSPVQIQIADIKRAGSESFHVVAGWAYKKEYERHQYKLTKTASGYDVQHVQRLEGNYVNDPELKKP
jgi:hypothetical protein